MSVKNRNADPTRLIAAILARRLAGLLGETTLGVAGLLLDGGTLERARLAVELAGAGRVVGVCHRVLYLSRRFYSSAGSNREYLITCYTVKL